MNSRLRLLALEPLEDRALLATCTVTNLLDVGRGGMSIGTGQVTGDLRFCINQANAIPGPDMIDFLVNGTIQLRRPLPDLASDIDIQGSGADLLTVRRNTGGDYRIFKVLNGATVQIVGLTITNGLANTSAAPASAGGGILNNGTLTLRESIVSKNFAAIGVGSSSGGGIYNTGNLTLEKSVVSENTASNGTNGVVAGGGIFSSGQLTLIRSTVTTNIATGREDGYGGGIYNSGALSVIDSSIVDNQARAGFVVECLGFRGFAFGGGIYNAAAGNASLYGSAVAYNQVDIRPDCNLAAGGGIYDLGVLSLLNSTISQNAAYANQAPNTAGGIWASGASALVILSHSTITHNHTEGFLSFGAAGLNVGLVPTFVRNTIIGSNSGTDLSGTLTSSGHNLFSTTTGGSGFSDTDLLNVDPMLGLLADDGGPTLTHALLRGSPAIDAGDNSDAPEFDQRGPGFPRIVNGVIDIGAFEVQATGAPRQPDLLAFLITDDSDSDEQDSIPWTHDFDSSHLNHSKTAPSCPPVMLLA